MSEERSEGGAEPVAPSPSPDPSRRSLLGIATLVLGGAMAAVMAVPLFRFFTFPRSRGIVRSSNNEIDVGAVDDLVAGAGPVKLTLRGREVRDAWSTTDSVTLGAAWVEKRADGTLTAFSTVCPHLGCSIDYDPGSDNFQCPCHRSAFGRDGERLMGPSKRGLDPLPVIEQDGRLRITHKRFIADIAERVEKS